MVPNDDEVHQLRSLESESMSFDTNTSLQCNLSSEASLPSLTKSDTFDSQAELAELENEGEAESPKHTRYSSPLFQRLLGQPIEPVKILRSPLMESEKIEQVEKVSSPTIPEDTSINNLLHTASLVSKTRKASETSDVMEKELTKSNDTNNEEAVDEQLLKSFLVAEKRPSFNDPEKVLMQDVVPGKKENSRT
jgi:hypothetical protein